MDKTTAHPRLALCVGVALAIAALTWFLADPNFWIADFHFYWRAARLWADGVDPYAMRPQPAFRHLWPLIDRLFYPLPTLLIVAPFAALPVRIAQTLFVATASGALAWQLSRNARWPLLIFCTPSFFFAAMFGQWSPWLVLGALVPSMGFLLAAKPTLGLACFFYRPTWKAFVSGAAIMFLSLAIMPDWPWKWLENLHSVDRHLPPIVTQGGFVLGLAAVRWRQRESRFLLAMACVPQLGMWADQLPLFLVCRTRREAAFFVLASVAAFVGWFYPSVAGSGDLAYSEPYALLGCYGPALYLVLRRSNEGPVPALLERAVSRWPAWLRGRPLCAEPHHGPSITSP